MTFTVFREQFIFSIHLGSFSCHSVSSNQNWVTKCFRTTTLFLLFQHSEDCSRNQKLPEREMHTSNQAHIGLCPGFDYNTIKTIEDNWHAPQHISTTFLLPNLDPDTLMSPYFKMSLKKFSSWPEDKNPGILTDLIFQVSKFHRFLYHAHGTSVHKHYM